MDEVKDADMDVSKVIDIKTNWLGYPKIINPSQAYPRIWKEV